MKATLLQTLLLFTCLATLPVCHAQPPADQREQGWAGPESLKLTEEWTKQQPKFELTHPESGVPVWQDNLRARHCQWEAVQKANRGVMPPNIRQPVGDCSSRGSAHALERTIAGQSNTFRRVAPQWLYGAGRVWSAKGIFRRGGDGCNVAFIAQAARDYGIVFQDDPGVPPYEGSTIREWGNNGPPEHLKTLAAERCVRRVALLKSVADVRDAVCNNIGVATGGTWGTADNQAGMYQRDGRWFARRNGSWSHVVCIDGYDGSAPSGPCYHITNSWGDTFFPKPIDGSPSGGYWVTEADIAYMVRDKDTWAFSEVDGFPARIDLSPLRPKPRPAGAPAVRPLARLDQTQSKEGFDHVPHSRSRLPGDYPGVLCAGPRLQRPDRRHDVRPRDRLQLRGVPGSRDHRRGHRPPELPVRSLPNGPAGFLCGDRQTAATRRDKSTRGQARRAALVCGPGDDPHLVATATDVRRWSVPGAATGVRPQARRIVSAELIRTVVRS